MFGFRRQLILLALANEPVSKDSRLRELANENRKLEKIFVESLGPEKKAWDRKYNTTLADILEAFRTYRNRIVIFILCRSRQP
jgi:hypothetical protein